MNLTNIQMNIRTSKGPGYEWEPVPSEQFFAEVRKIHACALKRPDLGCKPEDVEEGRIRFVLAKGGPVFLPLYSCEFRLDHGEWTAECARCRRIFLEPVGGPSPLVDDRTLICPSCLLTENSIVKRNKEACVA